jgi:HAD superfamily hydrolase (TIGR01509 family)
MGGDKLLPEVIGVEEDSDEGKPIIETRKHILKDKYMPTLRPTPGARALLQRIHQDGLQLVVATSSNPEDLKDLLKAAEIDDLIEAAASSGDAENSKPDPDIVQAALQKAGCTPDETIMLGDTPYDVQAASKAGVSIIALRCGGWSDPDLKGAIAIYDDPADLLAHYAESPLGKAEKVAR